MATSSLFWEQMGGHVSLHVSCTLVSDSSPLIIHFFLFPTPSPRSTFRNEGLFSMTSAFTPPDSNQKRRVFLSQVASTSFGPRENLADRVFQKDLDGQQTALTSVWLVLFSSNFLFAVVDVNTFGYLISNHTHIGVSFKDRLLFALVLKSD
ncbi:hypothetical protein NPIL_564431 [Nephila pilipes]|uniref:Uncharacterized protein n=1 Tax=Nephila pilipes TaxID=299642 RepID=A0A8X6PMH2_NEPPI|nr:hypothetical protein NPIL_564431 [Nephila pilipes]